MIVVRYGVKCLLLIAVIGLVSCGGGKSHHEKSSATSNSLLASSSAITNSSALSSSSSSVGYVATLTGKTEKGFFQPGSVVKITALDSLFKETDKIFISSIYNVLGEYSIPVSVANAIVKVEITGKFFNEFTNSIASEDITLTSYFDVRKSNGFNVNVLTHLASKRFLANVAAGHSTDEAFQLAANTVLMELGLKQNLSTPLSQLELNSSLSDNAELLGASAYILSAANEMVAGSKTLADAIAELLAAMTTELAAGTLEASTKQQYENGKKIANLATFKTNLSAYLVSASVTPNLPSTDELPNRAPIAVAGGNSFVDLGSAASLNGSASSDIDGDTLTFHWELVSAAEGSVTHIVEPNSPVANILLDAVGDYTIRLTVNDGAVNSMPVEIKLSTTKVPPIPKVNDAQFTVPTNQPLVLSGASSLNVNKSTLRYRWYVYNGVDNSILGSSSRATLLGEGEVFEFTPTHLGTYWYALTVADKYFDFPIGSALYGDRYIPDMPQVTYFKVNAYASFIDNGDGTASAIDGKLWQKAGDGLLYSMNVSSHFQPDETRTARYYCDNLTLAGKSDWRVPTYGELIGLVDNRYMSPTIDQAVFSAFVDHAYVSTTREGNITQWGVNFNTGKLEKGSSEYLMYYVRCIHD